MISTRNSGRAALATTLLLLAPSLAHAHTGGSAGAGFAHGFVHPLVGLDHLLAMFAVGVLAAQRGGRSLWTMPAAFAGMMLGGFAAGGAGIALPGVELAIAASVAVLGGAVARRDATPGSFAVAIVGGFALFHGHAHAAEMPVAATSATFAVGFLVATLLLHAAGAALAMGVRSGLPHRLSLDRLVGAAIAMAGLLLL